MTDLVIDGTPVSPFVRGVEALAAPPATRLVLSISKDDPAVGDAPSRVLSARYDLQQERQG